METNGTTYNDATPAAVVEILEAARASRQRLHIYYGDAETGRAWGDVESGYVGRSTGRVKIPLSVHNARSTGGGAILDHCIVKIETTRAPRRVLYLHPAFHTYDAELPPSATNINPRYLMYASTHGETDPAVMLERDRERWPGGVMVGFSLWIQEQWREFPGEPWEHEAFDAWLAAKVAS